MEIKWKSIPFGVIGLSLALAGVIGYHFSPEHIAIVTAVEALALIALILFFVTRAETVKAVSSRRSTRMGANSVVMVLLFIGIVSIVNFLAARHSMRWDLSENQNFSLAPQTHRVIRSLPREVKITVFTREKDPGYQTYKERLDSYRQASAKIAVEFVDPERQPKLAQSYGITRTDTAVFESGAQTIRVTNPSEAELTGALIRVSKDDKKRILFLEGHGEPSTDSRDRTGFSIAKEILGKQGYEVGTLSLLTQTSVPDNTSIVAIAGPRKPMTPEELDRIRAYVEKGGHLLVMVDPDSEAELNPLLKHWGAALGPGVLVDFQDRLAQGEPTVLLVRTFTEHEITQDLTAAVLFPLARHVTFDEQAGKDWDFVQLARTSPNSRAVLKASGRIIALDEKTDIKGPLAMAAALAPKTPPAEGKARPAIVVIGNSTFATNAFVNFPGNSDFFLHTAAWLAQDRDMIAIPPRDQAVRPFVPNPVQERTLLYVQVFFLPAVVLVAGVNVWRKRRRL
ncbi:MAG TPA: DUF4350 domain-containing protein [Nitrospira sp.]|nr:DUF4350 domain-containing protein [Nitrospira sp.]